MVRPPVFLLTGEPRNESGKQPIAEVSARGQRAAEGVLLKGFEGDLPMSIFGRADFSAPIQVGNQPDTKNHGYQLRTPFYGVEA